MQYIVLDMEWNQAISPKQIVREPVLLTGEIVQIGAVKLDEHFNMTDTFKIMVTPQHYTKMHYRVAQLTKLKTDDLRSGVPFPEAMARFFDFCGGDCAILTWGPDDIPMLRLNMQLHGMETESLPKSYNIQPIFDSQITKENRQCSLSYALEKVGEVPFDAHDALNDAKSTALLCRHIDVAAGIEQYAQFLPKRKVEDRNPRKVYASPRAAENDVHVNTFVCPACEAVVKCGEWLPYKMDRHIALAECACGERFFVRLRFRRREDRKFRVSRSVYALDAEHYAYYRDKYEKEAARRAKKQRQAEPVLE